MRIETEKANPRLLAWMLRCLLLAALLPTTALAQTVSRGPYLQSGSTSQMVVKWRTTSATDSVVRYGTTQGSLSQTAVVSGTRTNHAVSVTGLAADTKYFYSIGNAAGTLAGNDANHFFVTSPNTGTAKPTRLWILGDSGTANANARAVRDAFLNFTGTRNPDLMLMLGDNAYNEGTDNEHQAAVFDMYPTTLRNTVVWPTVGNHEARQSSNSNNETGPYYDIWTLPRNAEAGGLASGTEAYYSFDYGNIHFVCLESYEISRSAGGMMMTWLEADMAANLQPWVVAYWHHPPYSNGSHNSNTEGRMVDMREIANPILERWGVDLVLTGHSHSYERSFLIDGHYGTSSTLTSSMVIDGGDGRPAGDGAYLKPAGPSPNDGAVYVVAGSSGQTSGVGSFPAMFISLNQLGSLVVDIDGDQLNASFVRSTGAVSDTFTISKGIAPAVCGDNVVDPGESCDGTALGGETCISQGFGGGTLACNPTCSGFDTSACTVVNNCGNGIIDAGEVCDGANLGGETCISQGFDGGTLSCSSTCDALDTALCTLVGGCLHSVDFESGLGGWTTGADTCTTGSFVLGTPNATAWQVAGGAGGSANAFYTQPNTAVGTADVDGGTCEALSPTINTSGQSSVSVSLDYFHGQRDAGDDAADGFLIEVIDSATSAVLATVVDLGDGVHNPAWTQATATVNNPPSGIRLRVRASDPTPNGDIIEGGVDNIQVCPPTGAPVCGNDVTETGETCDGSDLSGESCVSQGFGGGLLACTLGCDAFDTSACTPIELCGNGTIDTGETCDGASLGGETCVSQGFGGGDLACQSSCDAFDTAACTPINNCGNGTIDAGETCDGTALGGETCVSQGFGGGPLSCQSTCDAFDTSACTAPTERLLVENASGSTKVEVNDGQKGAQSFRVGSFGDPNFFITKVVLYLSRDLDAPSANLTFTVGTGVNSGLVVAGPVSITPAQVTNLSEGVSFNAFEITFPSTGPLSAGTTYYLNLEAESSNGKKYYLHYDDDVGYSGGTYFKGGGDDGKDLRFQIWGSN